MKKLSVGLCRMFVTAVLLGACGQGDTPAVLVTEPVSKAAEQKALIGVHAARDPGTIERIRRSTNAEAAELRGMSDKRFTANPLTKRGRLDGPETERLAAALRSHSSALKLSGERQSRRHDVLAQPSRRARRQHTQTASHHARSS